MSEDTEMKAEVAAADTKMEVSEQAENPNDSTNDLPEPVKQETDSQIPQSPS